MNTSRPSPKRKQNRHLDFSPSSLSAAAPPQEAPPPPPALNLNRNPSRGSRPTAPIHPGGERENRATQAAPSPPPPPTFTNMPLTAAGRTESWEDGSLMGRPTHPTLLGQHGPPIPEFRTHSDIESWPSTCMEESRSMEDVDRALCCTPESESKVRCA